MFTQKRIALIFKTGPDLDPVPSESHAFDVIDSSKQSSSFRQAQRISVFHNMTLWLLDTLTRKKRSKAELHLKRWKLCNQCKAANTSNTLKPPVQYGTKFQDYILLYIADGPATVQTSSTMTPNGEGNIKCIDSPALTSSQSTWSKKTQLFSAHILFFHLFRWRQGDWWKP